jgi:excisionase family DNA binding protein
LCPSFSTPRRTPRIDRIEQYELPLAAEAGLPTHDAGTDTGVGLPEQSAANQVSPVQNPKPGHSTTSHAQNKQEKRKRKPPATAPLAGKLLVSREEAAAMLSISVRGVDYLIAGNRLTTRRIGARVLIPMEDVETFARTDPPERMAG